MFGPLVATILRYLDCDERGNTVKGVQNFFDEDGEPIAVLIDLKKNPEIWEDFRDLMIIEKRRGEPNVPAEVVYAKLEKRRKI